MTTSTYPDYFRDRFCRQEGNNLTDMQKDVMSQQYGLYEALRRTGSEIDQPSFMLAHHKVRHSPCSRCCGDDRYIAHRAMIVKELKEELEEQRQRRLSRQAEGSPGVSSRKRRVKSQDNVSNDPIPRSVNRTNVCVQYSSKNTKRKQSSSVDKHKEDSKPRDKTSSKHRARTEQPRKINSVKKNSHSTNRTASDLYNRNSCNQRSILRNKISNKRSSKLSNKPSSEERSTSCENRFELQEYLNDEKTEDTGFRIPADSKDVTINTIYGRQDTSTFLVTPDTTPSYECDRDHRVTFDEVGEIFNQTDSRDQQIENLRRLLIEKSKINLMPNRYNRPNRTRNINKAIPETEIPFPLPTIQGKRIPRNKQEIGAPHELRAKQEIMANQRLYPTQPARKDTPPRKQKSLPCVKTTAEHNVRGGYELRKQQTYRKEPQVNPSPSRKPNTSNRKRKVPSTTQRYGWVTSISINPKTNDNSLLRPPKAQQSIRRSASEIFEPIRVIISRKAKQNLERCNRKEKKCVPEHSRRRPKKKRVGSVSNNNMGNACLRQLPEQGCFHWVIADEKDVLRDTCTSSVPTTSSSLPRTNNKRLRRKKVGDSWNGESLKYGRGGEKVPHAILKEVQPTNKNVQFDTPRIFSMGTSRNRNEPLLASHRLP